MSRGEWLKGKRNGMKIGEEAVGGNGCDLLMEGSGSEQEERVSL